MWLPPIRPEPTRPEPTRPDSTCNFTLVCDWTLVRWKKWIIILILRMKCLIKQVSSSSKGKEVMIVNDREIFHKKYSGKRWINIIFKIGRNCKNKHNCNGILGMWLTLIALAIILCVKMNIRFTVLSQELMLWLTPPNKKCGNHWKMDFFVSCHKINFNKVINTMIHCHILSTLKAIRYC